MQTKIARTKRSYQCLQDSVHHICSLRKKGCLVITLLQEVWTNYLFTTLCWRVTLSLIADKSNGDAVALDLRLGVTQRSNQK